MLKRRTKTKTRLSKSILDKVDETEQFSVDQLYKPVKAVPSDFSLMVEEAEGVLSKETKDVEGGGNITRSRGTFILYGLITLILVSIGVIVMLLLKGGT